MTAKQLLEWRSYADLEPFDEKRDDYRAAQIAQMVLLVNLAKGKKLPTLDELVLRFGDDVAKPSAPPDDHWKNMKAIAQMYAAGVYDE